MIKDIDALISLLDTALQDDVGHVFSPGSIIKKGFHSEIDQQKRILEESHIWLQDFQARLVESTGISNIKIKFTNNMGYFIEVPKAKISQIPEYFVLRQSMLQVSRYICDELLEFQQRFDIAEETILALEKECLMSICNSVIEQKESIWIISRDVYLLDFLQSGAHKSLLSRYNTPEISSKSSLEIHAARHPVIEEVVSDFVSNSLELTPAKKTHVITGPNMWGKSTFLRQNALIIIISHIWYDIPSQKSIIPVFDRVFSRVWSGDNLFFGQSTFLVEMQEVSYILNNASSKSFIIIDEIGRGTSTYDGLSLAWAILKYIHDSIWAKTLFATHYHEIVDHVRDLKKADNYSVAVSENLDNIVFLRKIIPGWIKKSYGIEVARLSWVPREVLTQARKTMQDFEIQNKQSFLDFWESINTQYINKESLIEKELRALDVNSLSPIDALLRLKEFQETLKNQD